MGTIDKTYSELLLKILEQSIEYEQIINKSGLFKDDNDKLLNVIEYMERILNEVKKIPESRTIKGVACKGD